MDEDDDSLESYWAQVRSTKPRDPLPWGEELAARVWKEPVVAIAGSFEVREKALAEMQVSLAQTVVRKPCIMLHSPHVSISKAWLDSGYGAMRTLGAVFGHYGRVNQRPPVTYSVTADRIQGSFSGTLPGLLVDTLLDAQSTRTTWTVETGRPLLYACYDQEYLTANHFHAAERLFEWLGLADTIEVENDLCIARLMNFLYLANKVKTISNVYLSFDCLDQGNEVELRTIETMLKLIRDREDLFGCFALVLGWSGEDKMLNRLSKFAPVCEAALQNSLTAY